MGFPTANLDPASDVNIAALCSMRHGVYYGWARLRGFSDTVGVALNVGVRPTIDDGDQISIEAHVLRHFDHDFYGEEMSCLALGFIRPEQKFGSLEELVERIEEDVRLAKDALTEPKAIVARDDPRLLLA